MDEKKNENLQENSTEETTTQVIADNAIDDSTSGEEIAEEAATGEPGGMAAAKEIMEEKLTEESKPQKSKKTGLIIGIIAALIVLIVAGVTCYFYFFNKTLIGSWSGDTNGADTVLTFKDGGVFEFDMGAINVEGTYEQKDKNTVKIDASVDGASVMTGEFKYEITSGFTDRKLRLTVNNKTVEYTSAQRSEVTPPENFTPVDALIGKWSNEETGFTYEFTDNGLALFKKSNMTITLTYSATDSEITLKGDVGGNDQENTLPYTITDDKLVLAELEYVKQS